LAILLSTSVPATGWSNGTGGCNSFGTHDWVLNKAIKAAGHDASWVHVRIALRATDDPDCNDGIDHASGTWWHVYDRWGDEYGGADEATAVWFRRTKRRLEAGHDRAASRALGIMSHFVADVAQPMHTDSSDKEDGVHSSYESAVDSRSQRADHVYTFHGDGKDAAKPATTTRTVARRAHRYYVELIRAYDQHGYSRRVDRITRRQLNQAANALADLIASI
jgi:hypothetical protein